jgi:hypothetical protein
VKKIHHQGTKSTKIDMDDLRQLLGLEILFGFVAGAVRRNRAVEGEIQKHMRRS